MRDMAKFNRDQEQGLMVKSMRAGAKGLTTTEIDRAILRAMRRGRIDKTTARSCMDSWADQLTNRPQSVKWSQYASAQLNEVAMFRKNKKFGYARYTLNSVKKALEASRKSLH